ncbi:MAG: glycosyltransferase [Candidatus Omnitrophica bacterium]|nr:glycosyltransferase [Candidatus Omnitrophota bacterium]
MVKEKLAVIIPTKDRSTQLNRLLDSVSTQKVLPCQTIVIDAGGGDVESVLKKFPYLNIDYTRVKLASLTAQRNLGITFLKPDISLVCFFDDDVILQEDSLVNMMKFWEDAPLDVGGAAFNNFYRKFKKPNLFERFFRVRAERPGVILRSGFQSLPCSLERTMQVDWLIGCSMMFRKKVFNEFLFDEWFSGYAHCEDIDFCCRVGKKYRLFVVADAKILHISLGEKVQDYYSFGKMQILNRLYFVKKNNLSILLCYWACLGIFLNNLFNGLARFNRGSLIRAQGNISGFSQAIYKNFL